MLVAFTGFSKVNNSKEIAFHARHENEEALRSILPIRAILDGNTIQVEFFDSPESVFVKILDASGKAVVTEYCSSPQLLQLQVNQGNDYVIEIVYGEVCLYGNFSID